MTSGTSKSDGRYLFVVVLVYLIFKPIQWFKIGNCVSAISSAPNFDIVGLDWIVNTKPIINPVMMTNGKDLNSIA